MRRVVHVWLAAAAVLLLVAAPVLGATTPRFTKEDYTAFQAQLANGRVVNVVFNKKAHTLHISTKDGRLYVASYAPEQYKAISAQISAKGVPVSVEHVKKAGSTTTTTHHKLRYIAAGVLVLVVIVIAVVLGFNRRRPPTVEGSDAPAASGRPPQPDAGGAD
jgi:hypothetical protein